MPSPGRHETHISLSSLVDQESRKTYKWASNLVLLFPSLKPSFGIYHGLHLLLTMMLHKSLVAFIAAFSTAASANPVARGGGHGGGGSCNTGALQCCNTVSNISNPILASLAGTLGITLPVDVAIPIGISCLGILGTSGW